MHARTKPRYQIVLSPACKTADWNIIEMMGVGFKTAQDNQTYIELMNSITTWMNGRKIGTPELRLSMIGEEYKRETKKPLTIQGIVEIVEAYERAYVVAEILELFAEGKKALYTSLGLPMAAARLPQQSTPTRTEVLNS